MRNHHVNTAVMSTLQAPLLPTVRLRYTSSNSNSGTTFFSTISSLFILIHLISLPHQTCKKSYQTFHLLTYSYLYLYFRSLTKRKKNPTKNSPSSPFLF